MATGQRVVKHRHVVDDTLQLTVPEFAILGVLLLRGAQTPGELKQRAERWHTFRSLDDIEATLERLATRSLAEQLAAPAGPERSTLEDVDRRGLRCGRVRARAGRGHAAHFAAAAHYRRRGRARFPNRHRMQNVRCRSATRRPVRSCARSRSPRPARSRRKPIEPGAHNRAWAVRAVRRTGRCPGAVRRVARRRARRVCARRRPTRWASRSRRRATRSVPCSSGSGGTSITSAR